MDWLWTESGLVTMVSGVTAASAVCFVENDEPLHRIFAQSPESGQSGVKTTCTSDASPGFFRIQSQSASVDASV